MKKILIFSEKEIDSTGFILGIKDSVRGSVNLTRELADADIAFVEDLSNSNRYAVLKNRTNQNTLFVSSSKLMDYIKGENIGTHKDNPPTPPEPPKEIITHPLQRFEP